MLKVLRDSMKYLAWVLWAVIAVFVLFVFVDFGSSVPQPGSPTRAAATLGDREVTFREFEREYRQLEEQMRAQFGEQFSPELAEQLRLPMQALDRVINREILLAEAERLDLAVTDEEIRDTVLSYPAFRGTDGRFVGADSYARILRSVGYETSDFERSIRDQLLVERVLSALRSSVVVSPAEVEARYREQAERARIRYVQLPFGELQEQARPTPQEVRAHFEAHRDRFQIPEQRVARYLLVDQRQLRESIAVGDEEVAAYYQENGDEFSESEQVRARHVLVSAEGRSAEEARARAEEARRRIATGEELATVAAEMSDDPGSAARGGDLGYFGRGRMVPEFEQAAFGARPGELVGPFQSQFGWHVLQVEDRREQRVRPLEEVRELVRTRLAAERAESEAEALARRARTALGDQPDEAAFARVATENPAVEQGATQPFQAQGPVAPIGAAPALNQAAFALSAGQVSEPVRTPRGWVVLQVAEVLPPRAPALADVEGQVRREVQREQAAALAEQRLAAARERVAGGESLDAVAAELGLAVNESQPFGGDGFIPGLGANPELATAALALGEGEVGGPVRHQQGAVLFEVTERTTFDPADLERQRPTLRRQLEEEQIESLLSALIQAQRRELGVTYDRQLLEAWNMLDQAPAEG